MCVIPQIDTVGDTGISPLSRTKLKLETVNQIDRQSLVIIYKVNWRNQKSDTRNCVVPQVLAEIHG